MHDELSRRDLFRLAGTLALVPIAGMTAGYPPVNFRVRTITAGINHTPGDRDSLRRALEFLVHAREEFEAAGYEVQTVRLATQPFPSYASQRDADAAWSLLRDLDAAAAEHRAVVNIGPVIEGDEDPDGIAGWAADLIRATATVNFSVRVASEQHGIHYGSIRAAAAIIAAIARATPGGEGNFRFAAAACIPPGTPFFPVAWHDGTEAFAIGLETPRLLLDSVRTAGGQVWEQETKASMERAFAPVVDLAQRLAGAGGRRFLGLDVSPAPGLDASIGEVIEAITGSPFGSPSTLGACAAITGVLKRLALQTCGYSGLMLPVLEDPVLARRAAEGRYRLNDLLLYSSVCGTGLDVVPLPGDVSKQTLAAVIGDVAALSVRLNKPLSARLFPVPGKRAGEMARFDNPYLTDSVIMGAE